MLHTHEIAEEYDVTGKEVLTPKGWRRVKTVYKTVPLPVWSLRTTKHSLRCSGHHLVRSEGEWIHVRQLIPGDVVDTENGPEAVVECVNTGVEEELYDITVDDPSHAFYSSGIVSHNSTTLAARLITLAHVIRRNSELYITPTYPQLQTFAARLSEMEELFRLPILGQHVYKKRYANGSKIDLAYCLTSAKDVRGKTADCVSIDEVQDMSPEILPECLYTLTTSQRPMELYTGTALTIDTLLEQKWQESSKGCWHVRARDGKHWLNLYDEETLYKVCSHPVHPVCPYTGKKLIMTDGVYVHDNMRALEDGHIGLHVPQVMIPDLSGNPVRWRKIYDHVKLDDRIKVLQECFGIAVAEGSREITEQDLMYMCSMNISTEEILERCRTGYYKLIVSGCDWGGSDYNMATKTKTSYTVHCILGVAPDGGTDILYWHRYAGMQYPEIAAKIVKDHNLYHGMMIASDFGVGMAYNTELRNYLPFDRHFIMNYTGPDKEPIKENGHSALGNHLMINRTEAITNVFKDVKSIMPIIRARPWDEMKDFFKDWLHMYRIPTELPNGTKTFKYQRSATEADDALHAFTFAYVLVKVYLGQSLVQDMALENRLRAVMKNPQQAAMEYQQQQQAIFDTNYVLFG